MNFWWVNQGTNFAREKGEGYLWAPLLTASGATRPDWANMANLAPDDIVFTYSGRVLRGYCVITSEAIPWITPYPKGYGDEREGLMALAHYYDAHREWTYRRIVAAPPTGMGITLAAYPKLALPTKPSQGYLYKLEAADGQALWELIGDPAFKLPDPQIPKVPLGGTTRLRLATARVGQGEFGRGVREAFEFRCGVTRLSRREPFILHAAHIKPWSQSSDEERLDPSNGILLHATLHHAFDAGLVDFDESGEVLISTRLSFDERRLLGVPDQARLPASVLTPRRVTYLKNRRAMKAAA